MQTVFFDLRGAVLEELYQHHVETARIHPVLRQLDTALGDMCAPANDSLHAYLARSLLQAFTLAMQRILLDGGPYRWYPLWFHFAQCKFALFLTTLLSCHRIPSPAAPPCPPSPQG